MPRDCDVTLVPPRRVQSSGGAAAEPAQSENRFISVSELLAAGPRVVALQHDAAAINRRWVRFGRRVAPVSVKSIWPRQKTAKLADCAAVQNRLRSVCFRHTRLGYQPVREGAKNQANTGFSYGFFLRSSAALGKLSKLRAAGRSKRSNHHVFRIPFTPLAPQKQRNKWRSSWTTPRPSSTSQPS